MHETPSSSPSPAPPSRSGPSLLAILRRRWWLIALLMAGAVGVTLLVTLTAPPVYRSSLRLQALALDEQEVTLYTNLRALGADEQILLTQNNFSDVLNSPLIAWRTISDLGLDTSADDLIRNLTVTASGDFVTVAYEADSPQVAFDVLTRHVENALDHYNSLRARPASATGQFLQGELAAQNEVLMGAQDALLQFQLEHSVGDLTREINAVQDVLRGLESTRDAAQVEASRADALASRWNQWAADAEDQLAQAQEELAGLTATATPVEGTEAEAAPPVSEAEIAVLQDQIDRLQAQAQERRGTAQSEQANAAAQRAAVAAQETLISQRSADLTQLISLSSEYSALVTDVQTAQADFEFLRAKAAEARLKERQATDVGSLQVVETAALPTTPAPSPVLRLTLLAALVSLLLGLMLALLLEFVSPTPAAA